IAVIYAEGELVDGPGEAGEIGGERFRNLMRKARLDDAVKAVVLRVNSPGGSVYASESIRREIELTKAAKPVVVSMGDYAASGGYYISCQADSIFANPSTLTGSIGVYVVLFDASKLLGNTLGITSDEVFTAPAANLGSPARPLSPAERQYLQQGVDTTYQQFKGWVALGRKLLMDSVELLARGRIWSGQRAIRLGLADKLGGLHDAITCAANMAKLKEYSLLEWPVPQTLLQQITGKKPAEEADAASTDNQQERQALTLKQPGSQWLKKIQTLVDINGKMQMRLPYFIP
ncbi:MAG TPA: signal peptide peptidase SppA, partial [Phnomibacter sp.]|nr:signal peptide peptidase SppA [Phnomibacter sp.]